METSTKLTVVAAVFLVVVVAAIGIHMMSQDQDSDDGFTPNPPVSGDWNYTAYISANADKTTFYEGTLRITVEDNEMTRFQQNIVKTLASEMTDDELELALGEHRISAVSRKKQISQTGTGLSNVICSKTMTESNTGSPKAVSSTV